MSEQNDANSWFFQKKTSLAQETQAVPTRIDPLSQKIGPRSVSLPLLDEHDALIVTHCHTHFGANFSVMRDYYEKSKASKREHPGVHPEIELAQIEQLERLERSRESSLKDLLSPKDRALILEAQEAYQGLKKLYSLQSRQILPAQRLADLIFSEEEEPKAEMQALAELGAEALGPLIGLIEDDRFYHSGFPGYGRAPELAVRCLKHLQNPKAIQTLFHCIGKGGFFFEDVVLETLASLGEEARRFLQRKLIAQPITQENEQAAMALVHFPPNEELIALVIDLLYDAKFRAHPLLLSHLVLIAIATKEQAKVERLKALRSDASLPELVRIDLSQLLAHRK